MANYSHPVDEGLEELEPAIGFLVRRLAADGVLCEQDRRALERLRQPITKISQWRARNHFFEHYERCGGDLSKYGRSLMERAGIAEVVRIEEASGYASPQIVRFPGNDVNAG